MIAITSSTRGTKHYLAADSIARVTEADTSSQWHGTRSIVRTFDGGLIEAEEGAESIAKMILESRRADRLSIDEEQRQSLKMVLGFYGNDPRVECLRRLLGEQR